MKRFIFLAVGLMAALALSLAIAGPFDGGTAEAGRGGRLQLKEDIDLSHSTTDTSFVATDASVSLDLPSGSLVLAKCTATANERDAGGVFGAGGGDGDDYTGAIAIKMTPPAPALEVTAGEQRWDQPGTISEPDAMRVVHAEKRFGPLTQGSYTFTCVMRAVAGLSGSDDVDLSNIHIHGLAVDSD